MDASLGSDVIHLVPLQGYGSFTCHWRFMISVLSVCLWIPTHEPNCNIITKLAAFPLWLWLWGVTRLICEAFGDS